MYIVLYLANRGQSVYERNAGLPVRINESLRKKKKKRFWNCSFQSSSCYFKSTWEADRAVAGSRDACLRFLTWRECPRAGVLLPFQVPPQTLVFFLPPLKPHHPRTEGKKDKRPFGPFDLLSAAFTALGGVLTLRSGGFSSWKVTLSEKIFTASSPNKVWQLTLTWQQAAAVVFMNPPAEGPDLHRITRLV